jgi:transcriptional regulator with XRE-family HTH domain
MADSNVSPEFAQLVQSYLTKRELSGKAFAKLVEVDNTYLSRFLSGLRYPPEDLTPWADVLGLKGEERQHFLELGYLTRTHPFIVELVEYQRKELKKLHKALKIE